MKIDQNLRTRSLLAVLVCGPLAIWIGAYHPYTRARDLASQYELDVAHSNFNNATAVADFNGDGKKETIRKWPEHSIVVEDGAHEMLRLPYHHTDGSFKTHIALIAKDGAAPRLLHYDDMEGDGVRQVYAWNGTALSTAAANRLDKKVLYGMGTSEDRYMVHDLMMFLYAVGLFPYYIVLAIWVWRRNRKSKIPTSTQ